MMAKRKISTLNERNIFIQLILSPVGSIMIYRVQYEQIIYIIYLYRTNIIKIFISNRYYSYFTGRWVFIINKKYETVVLL